MMFYFYRFISTMSNSSNFALHFVHHMKTWIIKNMTRPMKKLLHHISSHGNKSHVTNSISSMHAVEKKLMDYAWVLVH
jgi:hypothetical protein